MTTTTPTPEELDRVTIDLIFALRDSLTDSGPSRLDFWSGGRATTALTTAAAGASTAAQAVTIAARKLQIDQLAAKQAPVARRFAEVVDRDFPAWAAHIDQTIVYIVALADIERQATRKTKTTTPATEEPTF